LGDERALGPKRRSGGSVEEGNRWAKLEEIVRRVVREEIASLKGKPKIELVGGKWRGISQDQMDAWGVAFPAVELQQQLNQAASWIVSNPHLAPKSHVGRFIHNWLTKAQNQAALRSIPTGNVRPTAIQEKVCAYCERKAIGNVNGIEHCGQHTDNAMSSERPPRLKLA
jgi:hypothetical protein